MSAPSVVLDALQHELDAKVELSYPARGFKCRIILPLRRVAATPVE